MGNVTSVQTTLTTGTDNQAFCYDEQNRLVWVSAASGTPPCGGTLTGGTLASAQYTASYSYDTLGRLTSAPLGSYTYGDPNHLDAATSVGSAYTASYDAAGDMTCRAPSNTVTCSGGTPTGAALTYDAERRLATWQNTPSNPTSTAAYWYDGEGRRVAQTYNGVTTYYVGLTPWLTRAAAPPAADGSARILLLTSYAVAAYTRGSGNGMSCSRASSTSSASNTSPFATASA